MGHAQHPTLQNDSARRGATRQERGSMPASALGYLVEA